MISSQSSFTAEFGGIESSETREREIRNTICAADTQSKFNGPESPDHPATDSDYEYSRCISAATPAIASEDKTILTREILSNQDGTPATYSLRRMRIREERQRGSDSDGKLDEDGKSSGNERFLEGAKELMRDSKGRARVRRRRGGGSSRKLRAIPPKHSVCIQVNDNSAHNGIETKLRASSSIVVPAPADDSQGHGDGTNHKCTTTTYHTATSPSGRLSSEDSHLKK